jgi:HEAT repeat protein
MRCLRPLVAVLVSASLSAFAVAAPTTPPSAAKVQALVAKRDVASIKAMGPEVLPVLVQLYAASNESIRTNIAETLWALGWKSPEAKQALMRDIHTNNSNLRLQVQWALGRVSGDMDVVEVLLDNMMNDANPLFRDKAACALAYDQVHLTEKQKVRLYEGLIGALSDTKTDVRTIAALALSIQTGQTKGFNANAAPAQRETAIREWKKWLAEYRSRW